MASCLCFEFNVNGHEDVSMTKWSMGACTKKLSSYKSNGRAASYPSVSTQPLKSLFPEIVKMTVKQARKENLKTNVGRPVFNDVSVESWPLSHKAPTIIRAPISVMST